VSDGIVEPASEAAAAAAERAGVRIADLHGYEGMDAVSALFDDVWGRAVEAGPLVPAELLTAMAHAGNQVTVAEDADGPVGATAAFLGRADDGEVFLHSHITGTLARAAGRGVGQALKWHQRAWCLERDIERVRWTFDPLVRRNAVVNLVLLGARALRYRRDLYGPMDDARNAGAPTDRLVVDWELAAPRVVAAANGNAAMPDVDALRRAGAEVALDVGPDSEPAPGGATGPRRLVRVPEDIESMRATQPARAAAWADAVREQLGAAMDAGFRISGVTRDGWYVLAEDRQVAELADRG
jgi:predicted GNAT superfamily acetyltransferase